MIHISCVEYSNLNICEFVSYVCVNVYAFTTDHFPTLRLLVWVCFWSIGVICLQTLTMLLIRGCLQTARRMELIWSLPIPRSLSLWRPFQFELLIRSRQQAATSWFWQQLWISCSTQVVVSRGIMKFSPNHLFPKSLNCIFIIAAWRKSWWDLAERRSGYVLATSESTRIVFLASL